MHVHCHALALQRCATIAVDVYHCTCSSYLGNPSDARLSISLRIFVAAVAADGFCSISELVVVWLLLAAAVVFGSMNFDIVDEFSKVAYIVDEFCESAENQWFLRQVHQVDAFYRGIIAKSLKIIENALFPPRVNG